MGVYHLFYQCGLELALCLTAVLLTKILACSFSIFTNLICCKDLISLNHKSFA